MAAVKIQKNLRRQLARRAYTDIRISALVVQTGFRAMAARKDFRFREQTKAATVIQVIYLADFMFLDKCNCRSSC